MPGPHVWFCHADCGTQYSHRFWREQALEVTAGQTCRVAPPRPPSASADNVERKREKACPGFPVPSLPVCLRSLNLSG